MARVHQQAAVIPYRIRKERVEVALVTTSRGKGWVVPKGSVDDGERPREAAIREAEEEAGLLGVVPRKPLGRYLHVKGNRPCRVDVYLMRVTNVLENWLEDKLRTTTLDAYPRCRGLLAGRAAAVRPRCRRRGRTGLLSGWQAWAAIRRPQPNPCTSSGARCHRRRSREACRRSCRRGIIRSSGTGSPCWTRSTAASDEREHV